MPKLIISIDGVVLREVELTQERTTLGRRPYNDIVIDHLTISGEHALLHLNGSGAVELEDLKSTNGSHVNGQPVQRQQLANGDTLELGKYKMRFVAVSPRPAGSAADPAGTPPPRSSLSSLSSPSSPPRLSSRPGSLGISSIPAPLGHAVPPVSASIQVLSGNAAGRTVQLTKVVTTIGKPGVAVASITKRHQGFVLAHVEGEEFPQLNGNPIGAEPMPLANGDRVALAGTEMEFILR